jgi:protein-disulfide isomerase
MFAAFILSLFLSQASPDVTVYVFTTTDCPISNRYAPEIKRLATKFSGRAKFILVYPVPNDSPAMIREHATKFAYSLDTLRDTDQKLVKQTGVTVTPEVAVMSGPRVMYRGRIDDRYIELGNDRLKPTRHDLEDALSAVIAGQPVSQRETRAVGCFLADLLK